MRFEDDARFDDELRRACKVEDPGDAFTERVLDRVNADAVRPVAFARQGTRSSPAPAWPSRMTWRVALPFAAALAIAVGGVASVRHARYVEEGERARAQVLMALRVTSEKLNVVRSAVTKMQEPH
jgi:hypothetical protein